MQFVWRLQKIIKITVMWFFSQLIEILECRSQQELKYNQIIFSNVHVRKMKTDVGTIRTCSVAKSFTGVR